MPRPPEHIVTAKLAEVARRYKRRFKAPPSLASLRIRDLMALARARHGHVLPDTHSGRDLARIIVHHLALLSGDPRKRITGWLRLWCPWLSLVDAEAMLVETVTSPMRWRADNLGWRLQLNEQDRTALRITTIGAVDLSRPQRAARRAAHSKARKLRERRAHGAKPRAEYLASVALGKPWIAAGMSRATWYRKRARET